MKIVALLLALFAMFSSGLALKDPVCGLPHSWNYNEYMISCQAYMPSYSYNPEINECVKFIYGGCGGNDNRFWLKEDCEAKCKE